MSDARLSAALTESFNLALRRYRPHTSSGAEEGRRRPVDRSTSRSTSDERVPKAKSSEVDGASSAVDAAAPEGSQCSQSLASLMRSTDPGAAALHAAKPGGAEARRARRSGVAETPHCVEVVDPRTGMRFVLSREGDVWLLSIQSQTALSRADLDALLATLRAQFADRGLGSVDIVIA